MKRLSKSATDLSPCKRKKHSNSEDEEFEEGSRSESARTDGSDEEVERPGSAQSSVSVPTISLIGSTKRIKYQSRGRSRSEHHQPRQHHQPKIPHERSIAAEIAAVPKTSHFGIFGLLKQKFGLHARERESMVRSENCQQVMVEEDATPQVVRIKCQADNYQADTESVGSPSPHRKPQVIRRKVVCSCYILKVIKMKVVSNISKIIKMKMVCNCKCIKSCKVKDGVELQVFLKL